MNVACGTDIIEIERIKQSIERTGKKFLESIYTTEEIHYCEAKKAQKYQHYAARFAAKEAIFKALSTKLHTPFTWQDFSIMNDENGKPKVCLQCSIPELQDIDISLSHCKTYAVATVVASFATK